MDCQECGQPVEGYGGVVMGGRVVHALCVLQVFTGEPGDEPEDA